VANDKATEPKEALTDTANKGVMSANATATSKNKTANNSSTNGNGSAPKNKKGSLDPNRLPDSNQDHTVSSDVDITKNAERQNTDNNVDK
jgi:hypothetical protein